MKNIHGKIVLLFVLLSLSTLNAKESKYCSYAISSSKNSAIINEPVNFSFTTRQKIHTDVMFFDLIPKKSSSYEIISIKEKRHEFNYHDAKKEFEFLLIPKVAGEIDVLFDFQIRYASDDAVAQAYTGSRDNVKSIPTIKVHIDTPSLKLKIQKPLKPLDAVGTFDLEMSIDRVKANAYETINVVYTLKGKGHVNEEFEPISSIENVSIFKGKKSQMPRATNDGYIYNKEWSYAFVAKENFTLPSVSFRSYNYKTKSYKTESTLSKNITITPLDIKTLLDDEESPDNRVEFQKYIEYFYKFLIFVAGFLFAKLLAYLPSKLSKKEDCCILVKKATTPKELLKASVAFRHLKDLDQEIIALEELVYTKENSNSFKILKKKIITKLVA